MKGLQCRGNLQNGSTANSNDVAFMIVYDKRPTGALPTVSDILVSASSSAMNNDANTGRFSILKRHDDIPDRKPDCSGQLDRGDCEEL